MYVCVSMYMCSATVPPFVYISTVVLTPIASFHHAEMADGVCRLG